MECRFLRKSRLQFYLLRRRRTQALLAAQRSRSYRPLAPAPAPPSYFWGPFGAPRGRGGRVRGSRPRVGVAGGAPQVHVQAGPSPVCGDGRARRRGARSSGGRGTPRGPPAWGRGAAAREAGGGRDAGSGRGPGGPPVSEPARPAGRAVGAPRSSLGPDHRPFPTPRELTQNHRREEKQLIPPDSRLRPHHDPDPDASGRQAPGQTQLRARPRSPSSAAGGAPGPPSAPGWPAPRPFALRLEDSAASPLSDSPPPGAAPPGGETAAAGRPARPAGERAGPRRRGSGDSHPAVRARSCG